MEITPEQLKNIIKDSILECGLKKNEKLTLTMDECARLSGIGRNKLTELAYKQNTDFPFFKVGSKFLVNRQLLQEWLKKICTEHREI